MILKPQIFYVIANENARYNRNELELAIDIRSREGYLHFYRCVHFYNFTRLLQGVGRLTT